MFNGADAFDRTLPWDVQWGTPKEKLWLEEAQALQLLHGAAFSCWTRTGMAGSAGSQAWHPSPRCTYCSAEHPGAHDGE